MDCLEMLHIMFGTCCLLDDVDAKMDSIKLVGPGFGHFVMLRCHPL